jgi:hypothetical protein
LRSLSSLNSSAETEPTKKEVGYNPRCTLLEAGPRWGTLVPVMSRSPDRRSTLERGSPETEPRSCGTQPAHESLFNRRLRVLSPAVRTTIGAVRSGGVKNCALPLESEHESRLLNFSPADRAERI